MDWSLYVSIVDQVADMGTRCIVLAGDGDPLVHARIAEMLAYATERGIGIVLLTSFVPSWNLQLDRFRIQQIGVNVSAGDAATYARFHPPLAESDYDRVIQRVRRSIAAGIRVQLIENINRVNMEEMTKMVCRAAELGAGVFFKTMDLRHLPEGERHALELSTEERQRILVGLMPEVGKVCRTHGVPNNLPMFAATLDWAAPSDATVLGCRVGAVYARIHIDGRVSYCCNNIPVGDMRSESFKSIWFGRRYETVRRGINCGQFPPGCDACGNFSQNWRLSRLIRPFDHAARVRRPRR